MLVTQDGLAQEKSEFVVSDSGYSSDDIENDSGDEQDGSDGEQEGSADEEDGEDEPFDSVCSICDEGGPLLWYVYAFLIHRSGTYLQLVKGFCRLILSE